MLNDCWLFTEKYNDIISARYFEYKYTHHTQPQYKLMMLKRNFPIKQKYWEIVDNILKEII